MMSRDRELLAHAARVNRHLGDAVVRLLCEFDDDHPPAEGLAALGQALSELARAFSDRHAELTGTATEEHAALTWRQWVALDDVLAEMCERSQGRYEDLHDRGRGVLAMVRPVVWGATGHGEESTRATRLCREVSEVVGALAHLVEAAPEDARAVRSTGASVSALGRRMEAYPAEVTPAAITSESGAGA
ncbi:hypothetical protein [Saccharomonospora iraqiensis]|uniref:hypothetical protein n=1 Tax=Saccharomonospora iraqiensis TaxID=52698 RepID=UPI00022DE996|nr:hypothetical protein [Saccharomonospora iraqiensis]